MGKFNNNINLNKKDYIKLTKHLNKKAKPTQALKNLMSCGIYNELNINEKKNNIGKSHLVE